MKSKNKFVTFFLIELIYTLVHLLFFMWMRTNYNFTSAYDSFLFFALIIVLLVFIWAFGPAFNRYVVLLYTTICVTVFSTQKQYYQFHQEYFSYQGFWSLDFLSSFLPFLFLLILNIVFIILYIQFQREVLSNHRKCFRYRLFVPLLLCLGALSVQSYQAMIQKQKKEAPIFELQNSSYAPFLNLKESEKFVEEYGLLTYVYEDYKDYSFSRKKEKERITEIDAFLMSRKKQEVNEFTGLFQNKNAIVIQVGALIDLDISPQLMPTLYKMKNEGLFVNGFQTPRTSGYSVDTEWMANTSLIPDSRKEIVNYVAGENTLTTTLPKIFESIGYKTNFYHGDYGVYYNRFDVYENFGYDNIFYSAEMGYDGMMSDVAVADVYSWITATSNTRHMDFWLTGGGDDAVVEESDIAHVKEVYPFLEEEKTIRHFAQAVHFDRALTNLIRVLEEQEVLSDFVFVIYGDGNGPVFDKKNSFYEKTSIEYHENKNYADLIIYQSDMETRQIQKPSTALDLIPTIANLWNVGLDESTFLGNDILDPSYHGFFFNDGIVDVQNWKSNLYAYDFTRNRLTVNEGVDYSWAAGEMNRYIKMMEISKWIIEYDYFK